MRFTPLSLLQLTTSCHGFQILAINHRVSLFSPYKLIPRIETRKNVLFSGLVYDLEPYDPDEDDDEEEDEDDDEESQSSDPYLKVASSEFKEESNTEGSASGLSLRLDNEMGTSNLDWGGAYGKLSERMEDIQTGRSQNPSQALFRVMTSETPNQAISNFLRTANPQVVGAMRGAVSSLLGGLSRPGMDTIVRTTGDKIGNLCFQLQMTGYMFRNAEYVMALKELMQISGGATLEDYREAFDRLDQDQSGYIDTQEIEALLADVYDGKVPGFEIQSFLKFFDSNRDGRISWQEFENGLGNISQEEVLRARSRNSSFLLPSNHDDDDDDDFDESSLLRATVTGTIEIELENGQVLQVEADEYIKSLKKEAEALKEALRRELGSSISGDGTGTGMIPSSSTVMDPMGDGITSYIASRKDDLQMLTESVQPEIMQTMRMLVDFVLEGGTTGREKSKVPTDKMEMELPGMALQQLALWQLILGYKLREAEATGDYLKLLE